MHAVRHAVRRGRKSLIPPEVRTVGTGIAFDVSQQKPAGLRQTPKLFAGAVEQERGRLFPLAFVRSAVGLLFAIACLAAGSAAAFAEDRPPAISVVTARLGDLAATLRVVGSLVAREESVVKVDLDDIRIVAVLAEAGDVVRKGDVLARLDATLLEAEQSANAARLARADAVIAQMQSQIDDARLVHAQADADLQRSQKLRAKGFATEETLEVRQTALKRAKSAAGLAERALAVAQADRGIVIAEGREIATRLSRTVILAPASGRVLRRTAKAGALAAKGGEPLFAIAEGDEIELEAEVTEADFARLAVGQAARIVVAGESAPLAGRVRLLLPELEAASRLGRARIALTPVPGLRVGAFARGNVDVERRGGVLLPATAVSTRDGSPVAQIVDDGRIVLRPIETGLRTAGLVEIRSGLAAGEKVVLRAGNFLAEGDRVTPVDVAYPRSSTPERPVLTSDAAR